MFFCFYEVILKLLNWVEIVMTWYKIVRIYTYVKDIKAHTLTKYPCRNAFLSSVGDFTYTPLCKEHDNPQEQTLFDSLNAFQWYLNCWCFSNYQKHLSFQNSLSTNNCFMSTKKESIYSGVLCKHAFKGQYKMFLIKQVFELYIETLLVLTSKQHTFIMYSTVDLRT